MVKVQENLYYQEHGVINYFNDTLFSGATGSLAATTINFTTKVVDPRDLVTTGANWAFRSPRARLYNIRVLLEISSSVSEGLSFDDLTDGTLTPTLNTSDEDVVPIGTITYAGGGLFHTHDVSDYSGLIRSFTNSQATISLRKNGVALTAGVFKQNPSVTIGVETSSGLVGFQAYNGQAITGWLETTVALDTGDVIDAQYSYNFSPITFTIGGTSYIYLQYNASGKAYIFITEVSKRT